MPSGNVGGLVLPLLIDLSTHTPRNDLAVEWVVWYCDQPGARPENLKKAKMWFVLVVNLQLASFGGTSPTTIVGDTFWESLGTRVRGATAQLTSRFGAQEKNNGKSIWARADKPLSRETVDVMLQSSLECDSRLHVDVLRCLQLRFELLALLYIGCRSEILRKSRMLHIKTKMHTVGTDAGMRAFVLKNCDGDKTHITGDAAYFGVLPARDPYRCVVAAFGLAQLYRFGVDGEEFPLATGDRADREHSYVWRTLLRSSGRCPIDYHSQNDMFNRLYNIAGHLLAENDAVTHIKSQCVSEAQQNGVHGDDIDRALFTPKDVKSKHYDPEMSLSFMLQRAGYGADFRDAVQPAHLAPLLTHMALLDVIIDSVVGGLKVQEDAVAALKGKASELLETASSSSSMKRQRHDAQMDSKRFMSDHSVQDADWFCDCMRYAMRVAICALAARMREHGIGGVSGRIHYDGLPMYRAHSRSRALGQASALRMDGVLLVEHPTFLELARVVRVAEEAERAVSGLTPRSRKIVDAVARIQESAGMPSLSPLSIPNASDTTTANAGARSPVIATLVTSSIKSVSRDDEASAATTSTAPNPKVIPVSRRQANSRYGEARVVELNRYVTASGKPSVQLLWDDYAHGLGAHRPLWELEAEGAAWRRGFKSQWSKVSVFHHALARRAIDGNVSAAIVDLQCRLDVCKSWTSLLAVLRREQTDDADRAVTQARLRDLAQVARQA